MGFKVGHNSPIKYIVLQVHYASIKKFKGKYNFYCIFNLILISFQLIFTLFSIQMAALMILVYLLIIRKNRKIEFIINRLFVLFYERNSFEILAWTS